MLSSLRAAPHVLWTLAAAATCAALSAWYGSLNQGTLNARASLWGSTIIVMLSLALPRPAANALLAAVAVFSAVLGFLTIDVIGMVLILIAALCGVAIQRQWTDTRVDRVATTIGALSGLGIFLVLWSMPKYPVG